jgi:uncharacterized membrane protein (UPF0127 family)
MKSPVIIVTFLSLLCLPGLVRLTPAQTNPPNTVAQPLKTVVLRIGKATLDAEIAITPEESARGLGFRSRLNDNAGMIFILPFGRATFWMKDCLIPLSVAFLDKDGVILEIHDMMAPDPAKREDDSSLPLTRSDSDQVAYAIEANLHWFTLNGIKPGEKVEPPVHTLRLLKP